MGLPLPHMKISSTEDGAVGDCSGEYDFCVYHLLFDYLARSYFHLSQRFFRLKARDKGNSFGVVEWSKGFGAGTLVVPVMISGNYPYFRSLG